MLKYSTHFSPGESIAVFINCIDLILMARLLNSSYMVQIIHVPNCTSFSIPSPGIMDLQCLEICLGSGLLLDPSTTAFHCDFFALVFLSHFSQLGKSRVRDGASLNSCHHLYVIWEFDLPVLVDIYLIQDFMQLV